MDEKTVFKIGQRINALRTEKNLSAEELAAMIGKDRSTVYRYENGEIQDIPLAAILDIAKALKVTPTELICWTEKEQERIRLDIAKEKAAAILLRQMEKDEEAFEVFMKEKEQRDRPAFFKENLLPALCQLGQVLANLRN